MELYYHQMKKDNGARYQIARRGLARDPNTFAQYDATNAFYAMIATMIDERFYERPCQMKDFMNDIMKDLLEKLTKTWSQDFMSNVVVIGDYVECMFEAPSRTSAAANPTAVFFDGCDLDRYVRHQLPQGNRSINACKAG